MSQRQWQKKGPRIVVRTAAATRLSRPPVKKRQSVRIAIVLLNWKLPAGRYVYRTFRAWFVVLIPAMINREPTQPPVAPDFLRFVSYCRHCDICKDFRLEIPAIHSRYRHNYRFVIWYCGIWQNAAHWYVPNHCRYPRFRKRTLAGEKPNLLKNISPH